MDEGPGVSGCRPRSAASRIVPASEQAPPERAGMQEAQSGYRTWAELRARTFGVDALACPARQGSMRLVAVLRGPSPHRTQSRLDRGADRAARTLAQQAPAQAPSPATSR